MTHEKKSADGVQEVPAGHLLENAFPLSDETQVPHLCLDWEAEGYVLAVYRGHPIRGELMLGLDLRTLIVAEAEFTYEGHRNGRAVAHLIAESNAEIEAKALALEAMAAELRTRHKRPEIVVGAQQGGDNNG